MLIVDTVITEKNAKKFSINSKTINKDSLILTYLMLQCLLVLRLMFYIKTKI